MLANKISTVDKKLIKQKLNSCRLRMEIWIECEPADFTSKRKNYNYIIKIFTYLKGDKGQRRLDRRHQVGTYHEPCKLCFGQDEEEQVQKCSSLLDSHTSTTIFTLICVRKNVTASSAPLFDQSDLLRGNSCNGN